MLWVFSAAAKASVSAAAVDTCVKFSWADLSSLARFLVSGISAAKMTVRGRRRRGGRVGLGVDFVPTEFVNDVVGLGGL